jgi:hypothetical protein
VFQPKEYRLDLQDYGHTLVFLGHLEGVGVILNGFPPGTRGNDGLGTSKNDTLGTCGSDESGASGIYKFGIFGKNEP